MMKLRILLTNVWLLSMIPFVIIVIFAPINVKKYSLILQRTDIVTTGYYIFYNDLDKDGISERIVAFDQFHSSGISISNRDGIIDQWNFKGSFDFPAKKNLFIIGDKDNDDEKEIYAFTLSDDTILLHCINNLNNSTPAIENRMIAIVGKGIKQPDPNIIPAEMDDLDNDGIKELIFGISTGFSKYPRGVYAYYISKDSLVVSPESSYNIQGIYQADITGDGKKELLPWGFATGSIEPAEAQYHDCSSYLVALDRNLKFLFKPVEFWGKYSHLHPFLRKTNNTSAKISGLYAPKSTNSTATIYSVDSHGTLTDSIDLGFHSYYIECVGDKYLFPVSQNDLMLYDGSFKQVKTVPFSTGSYLLMDIDEDGKQEYIVQNTKQGYLYIFREGLTHPASVKVTIATTGWDILTLRKGYEADPSISLQTGQNHYIITYKKNKYYLYSYLSYPGIYFSILVFALLIRNVQRSQMKKRYENEKKISELQMALVRNQLDPHFTLNALNSILYSVNYGDRNEAADSLRCFAGMYRDMVLSAGSSRRTIAEEIAFCMNYLTLEKMRYGARFNYAIDVDENLDQNILIPKLLIQIHAENAVKHGLAPLETGGMLKIKVSSKENGLLIEISDNGIGRERAKNESQNSTKKGLEVMKELYNLYYKFYHDKIISEITDLYDDQGSATGTKVLITVIRPNNPE